METIDLRIRLELSTKPQDDDSADGLLISTLVALETG